MKRFWLLVLLSVMAIGCTPAPQPSGGGGGVAGTNSTTTNSTTTSNTTTSNTTAE